MILSAQGLSEGLALRNGERWLLVIATGVTFALLLATITAFALAHKARTEAARYLDVVISLRIGSTHDDTEAELRKANIFTTCLPSDRPHECVVSCLFVNKWQAIMHLAPATGLLGQLDFEDGKLVHKETILGGDPAQFASVSEYASAISRVKLHQYKILVDLSPSDFTEYRKMAYAFNLTCIGSMKGCRTDEFLPTVIELEHATPTVNELEDATPSSILVHDFTAKSYTPEVLYRLAVKYHVVIGVYGTMLGTDNKIIDISIKNGTLGDALDAITKADPQFEWHRSSNGGVHFVSRSASLSLMDVTVHSFEVDDPQDSEILGRLQSVPEVKNWFQKRNCPMNDSIMGTGGKPTPWGSFSVHARDLPVSSILDEIAAKSRSYFWSFIQYGPEPCTLVMVWRDPQP